VVEVAPPTAAVVDAGGGAVLGPGPEPEQAVSTASRAALTAYRRALPAVGRDGDFTDMRSRSQCRKRGV